MLRILQGSVCVSFTFICALVAKRVCVTTRTAYREINLWTQHGKHSISRQWTEKDGVKELQDVQVGMD